VGLCDLIGPVTGVNADSTQSFGYNMACKVQQRKITKNLSGTAISSRQSSLAACVRAASTSYSPADMSRNKCLEICLNEFPHTSCLFVKVLGFCSDLVGKKNGMMSPLRFKDCELTPADYWLGCGQQTSIPGMHSQPENESSSYSRVSPLMDRPLLPLSKPSSMLSPWAAFLPPVPIKLDAGWASKPIW
jgi:hypothetical protein